MTDRVLCFYHADCADGLGAAWAVHRALGDDVEFVAVRYGERHDLLTPAECVASGNCPSQDDTPRSCNICDGGLGYCKRCHRAEAELDQPCGIPSIESRDILIVDFSYPIATLRAMAVEARSVLVLDHHKTAQEDLSAIPYMANGGADMNLATIFDLDRSGAGITWDYLHPLKEGFSTGGRSLHRESRPRIIDLIEDRDLWRFRYGDETRAFHAVLTSYDIADLPAMFERLDLWHNRSFTSWENMLDEGRAVLRDRQQSVVSAVAGSRRIMSIAGLAVPVASVPHDMASDAGHLLCELQSSKLRYEGDLRPDGKWGLLFSATYYDGADGKRHFSLRSPEGGADCGAIARQMADRFNELSQEPSDQRAARGDHYNYVGPWAGGGHVHAAGFDAPIGWEGE